MADPVNDLLAVAQATPDPRAVSNWITAYLGKRPPAAKQTALQELARGVEKRTGGDRERRAATMVLHVIRKLQSLK